jgi:hypothetical protein
MMTKEEYDAGEPHDDDFEPQRDTQTGGVVLGPDDFEVGQLVCVYNMKKAPDEAASIMGQSVEIKAICLPYFVVKVLSDASNPIITLDSRFLNMMKVTKEFAQAQIDGAGGPQPPPQPVQRKVRKPQPDEQ